MFLFVLRNAEQVQISSYVEIVQRLLKCTVSYHFFTDCLLQYSSILFMKFRVTIALHCSTALLYSSPPLARKHLLSLIHLLQKTVSQFCTDVL